MSGTPSFSAEEIRRREQTLLRCFDCCDSDGDGVIDAKELEAVARAFTSANQGNPSAGSGGAAHGSQGGGAGSTAAQQQAASAGMNVDQEVRVILGKLDRNGDGLIDREEWVSQLNELFKFMHSTAFEKHAAELLTTANHIHTAASGKQQQQQPVQQIAAAPPQV